MDKVPKAILKSIIPKSRYILDEGGVAPKIGDILELDQSFTGANGKPMVLAYHQHPSGEDKYQADVYESEIEILK